MPADAWCKGCAVVIARGDSMIDEGINDGAKLVVRPVNVGGYRKGQVVVATVDGAAVVKVYAGQGRSASPPLKAGYVCLRSANREVDDIIERKGTDGVGIEIKAIVIKVL